MSSTIYINQNPTPVVTRRSPTSTEDTGNNPQRAPNRRSLSGKLRNIFRRNSSSSPNRATSNDRRSPTIPAGRQGASTPTSGKSSTDAPHLQAPSVPRLFGKKKSKLPATASTPTTSKKKIKASQKKNQAPAPPMEISSPIYQQENQTFIQGQVFSPRTPELVHSSTERLQSSSSSAYEGTTTAKGFRDYVVIDQTQYSQQVVVPNLDDFPPPTYTSDRSRSPSMNRQRSPNTNIERHYYHDNLTPTGSIPIADIEVIPTPSYKRKVEDVSSSTHSRVLTEKPPIYPPTSTITTNSTQSKNTSSSTLNKIGVRSTATDVDAPKLNAPTISFGSTSNKKKAKRSKSQSRTDAKNSSSSTIDKLAQQTPTKPDQSWRKTYGSLPDAEIIYGGSSISSLKPSKPNINRYPGISAIVQHHIRLPPVYYNERPFPTTTTTTTTIPSTTIPASPHRPQRFETSTTTMNEYEEHQPWSRPINISTPPSPSKQRHDGYIRPLTPQKPSVQPDVSIIRVDISDLRGRSPSPRSSRSPRSPRYEFPEPPIIYRSSATIYTRDKHHYVDGGEIRTWSSHDTGISDDYNDSYKKPPYTHVEVNYKREQPTNGYDTQIVPSKSDDSFNEYRYSPRAHEQQLYEREHKIITDQEIQEEEKYEVSYEYEQQQHHQQYAYETKSHYDQLHSASRYSNDFDDDQNVTYANLTSTTRSSAINERDKIYDQSSRSYTSSENIQEPLSAVAPVHNSKEIPRSYTLKRTDSYDGLGISISASSQTRSNHFIRDVEHGSPGHRAGLRKNDRVISINGVNVENVDFSNVLILIKQGLDNDNLQLSVIHEPEQN